MSFFFLRSRSKKKERAPSKGKKRFSILSLAKKNPYLVRVLPVEGSVSRLLRVHVGHLGPVEDGRGRRDEREEERRGEGADGHLERVEGEEFFLKEERKDKSRSV